MRAHHAVVIFTIPLAVLVGISVAHPERGAVVIALISLVVISLLAMKLVSPVDSNWLVPTVIAGFIAKVAASGAAYWAIQNLFRGKGDAVGYHTRGVLRADVWRSFAIPETHGVTGTKFMDLATSFIFAPYEPTLLGGFVLFGTLGFLGQMALYAAFRTCFPGGRLVWYAAAIFFYPTIVYWTAPIGKEALMFLFMGPAVYAGARMLVELRVRWLLLTVVLLVPVAMLRAHVAALVVVSLLVAVVVRRTSGIPGGPARKLAVSTLSLTVAVAAIAVAGLQFNIDLTASLSGDLLTEEVDPFLTTLEGNTSQGGSAVEGEFITNPADLPEVILRVLYRPLPYEATNLASAVSSLEGVLLVLITIWRLPAMIGGMSGIRRNPYLVFSIVFTVGFVIAFSAILNLGLMARQRCQVLPFLFVLLIEMRRQTEPGQVEGQRQRVLAST